MGSPTKKVITFEVKRVTPSVTAPGDINLSDATILIQYTKHLKAI